MASQADPQGDTAAQITDVPQHAGEEPNAQIQNLNTASKDEIKAAAQATNELEARARAKTSSASKSIESVIFKSLARTDATMAHLNRLLATPSHQDVLLMTTSYTLHLLSAFLTSTLRLRLNRETQSLISKLRTTPLLPGEALVATISPSTTSLSYRLQTSSKALARLIDDFRMFTRLLSLIKMWAWGAATVRNPAKDSLLRTVAWTQVLACTVFQGLENAAYLATKGIVDIKGERIIQFYRWSARFWAVHVALEFVRLWRLSDLQQQGLGEKDSKADAKWRRDLFSAFAWFPMTWHYSITGGLLSDAGVASLGWAAGILGLREAWRVSA